MNGSPPSLNEVGQRLVAAGLDAALWDRSRALIEELHGHQQRNTGGSYLEYLLRVATLLESWQVEPLIVLGGLLHEVTTPVGGMRLARAQRRLADGAAGAMLATLNQMAKQMALAVEGERHATLGPLFELFTAHSDVALIHCAATLTALRDAPNAQDRVTQQLLVQSQEITQILLERLGLWEVRNELGDEMLRLRAPDRYYQLQGWRAAQWDDPAVQGRLSRWRAALTEALQRLPLAVTSEDILITRRCASSLDRRQHNSTDGRPIPMQERALVLTTILVPTIDDAYRALRAVHQCGQPLTAAFRDYFAQPRSNGYAALHTSVLHEEVPRSIQVTTRQLYPLTRTGILAEAVRALRVGQPFPPTWEAGEQRALRRFLDNIESLPTHALHLFTPEGERKELPAGATVLDFAYHIHSQLGQQAGGARVNGELVPLDHRPSPGDVIEILRDLTRTAPDDEWLEWVTVPRHKTLVAAQLRRRPADRGRELLDAALRQQGRTIERYGPRIADLAATLEMSSQELFTAIGKGQRRAEEVAEALVSVTQILRKRYYIRLEEDEAERFPQWHEGLLRPATCCTPEPDTPIIASRRTGIFTLHASTCPTLSHVPPSKLIKLEWVLERRPLQRVTLELNATNRKGLVNDITHLIRGMDADISYIEGRRRGEVDEVRVTLEIVHELELAHLIGTLRRLPGVNLLRVDGQSADEAAERLARHLSAPTLIPMLFSSGRSVSDERLFFGRTSEMRSIEQLLTHRTGLTLHLQGPKRIGKSSLLRILARRQLVRQRLRYVYVDLQGLTIRDEASLFRYIAREIRRALAVPQQVALPTRDEWGYDPAAAFMAFLDRQRRRLHPSPKKLTLALDEVAHLLDAHRRGTIEASVFTTLRHILDQQEINAILCTSTDIDAALLTAPGVRDLFGSSLLTPLGHLEEQAARDLVNRPLRGYVYYEPDALEELLHMAGHHPFYLQLLGAALVTRLNRNRRRHIYPEDVRALVAEDLSLSGDEFAQYYRGEAEFSILRALAAPPQPVDGGGLTFAEIVARLRGAQLLDDEREIERHLFALMDRSTVYSHDLDAQPIRYRIHIPLFAQWLARSRPLHL